MPELDYGAYRTYEELHDAMTRLAEAYPGLSKLCTIGRSLQGRELWTMEITNHETGPAEEKPGLWIDGNTHSGEVIGSTEPVELLLKVKCPRAGTDRKTITLS